MKPKKTLGVGKSILYLSLGISLIELIFPEYIQGALEFAAIIWWNIWCFNTHLLPYLRRKSQPNPLPYQNDAEMFQNLQRLESALMLHVNMRITDHLHNFYPNASWAWYETDPRYAVLNGGIGRIRFSNADGFTYADVMIERNGNISCSIVQPMTRTLFTPKTEDLPTIKTIDPQVWYEMQGRKVLHNVITDLHSRGHATLTVQDNGDIVISQDSEEIVHEHLASFPARDHWPQLVNVFQREGLAAQISPKGLQLNW